MCASAYELLMEAKDDGEVMRMYGGGQQDNKKLCDVAMEPRRLHSSFRGCHSAR